MLYDLEHGSKNNFYIPSGLVRNMNLWLEELIPELNSDQLAMIAAAVSFFIHGGGLAFDMLVPGALSYPPTRYIGVFLAAGFHAMTWTMYDIGMFPHACIALLFLWAPPEWPCKWLQQKHAKAVEFQQSYACCYTGEEETTESSFARPALLNSKLHTASNLRGHCRQPCGRHYFAVMTVVCYIIVQCFLPYSHFLTPGMSTWMNKGLYGYSWDMMIADSQVAYINVTVVNGSAELGTGNGAIYQLGQDQLQEYGGSGNNRFAEYPLLIMRHVSQIKKRLAMDGMNHPQLYYTVYASVSKRYYQRIVDDHVDMASADWSVTIAPKWMKPLLFELENDRLGAIKKLEEGNKLTMNAYFADFPNCTTYNKLEYVTFVSANFVLIGGDVELKLCAHDVPEGETTKDQCRTLQPKANESIPLLMNQKFSIFTKAPNVSRFVFIQTLKSKGDEPWTQNDATQNVGLSLGRPNTFDFVDDAGSKITLTRGASITVSVDEHGTVGQWDKFDPESGAYRAGKGGGDVPFGDIPALQSWLALQDNAPQPSVSQPSTPEPSVTPSSEVKASVDGASVPDVQSVSAALVLERVLNKAHDGLNAAPTVVYDYLLARGVELIAFHLMFVDQTIGHFTGLIKKPIQELTEEQRAARPLIVMPRPTIRTTFSPKVTPNLESQLNELHPDLHDDSHDDL